MQTNHHIVLLRYMATTINRWKQHQLRRPQLSAGSMLCTLLFVSWKRTYDNEEPHIVGGYWDEVTPSERDRGQHGDINDHGYARLIADHHGFPDDWPRPGMAGKNYWNGSGRNADNQSRAGEYGWQAGFRNDTYVRGRVRAGTREAGFRNVRDYVTMSADEKKILEGHIRTWQDDDNYLWMQEFKNAQREKKIPADDDLEGAKSG
ncbi:hypothetical protein DFH09DRAFT_1097265 [Mycena vulgaris]|nr:hypothetical protein DFH09DRAFT_1097265 [Mycena vulgaris]